LDQRAFFVTLARYLFRRVKSAPFSRGGIELLAFGRGIQIIQYSVGLLHKLPRTSLQFASRDRKKIKILYWDRTGFALWSKKLEKEKFPWPKKFAEAVVKVGPRELSWLLDGYEFWKMKPHEELQYASVS
jgi:transposase